MDPLSLTASIIAVLGAARAGVHGLKKLQILYKAPREARDLQGELEKFQALVQCIQEIQEMIVRNEHEQCASQLKSFVERGGDIVRDINSLLASPAFHALRLNDANQVRAVWLKHGKRLKTHQQDLKNVREYLMDTLQVLTASSAIRAENLVISSTRLQDSHSHILSSILSKMSLIESGSLSPEDVTSRLLQWAEDGKSTMSSLDLTSTARPTPSRSSTVPWGHSSVELSPDMIIPRRASDPSSDHSWRASILKQKCIDWCSCVCHTQTSFTSPRILRTVLGHILFEYTAKGSECNEHHCRRSRTPSSAINMVYQFPRYVMSRYINMAIKYNPIDGPKFSLRVPRIMDWPHPLFKYANDGNFEGIQTLFSQGEASPFDVNPRGTNVLTYAAAHGHPRIGRFLLENGADAELADIYGKKPVDLFWERALSGQFDEDGYHTVQSMFQDTDYVENRHFTTIHKIVLRLADINLKSQLSCSTANINNVDAHGRTALCWACIRDDLLSVDTLLASGADPNIPDNEDDTCLHFARSAPICQSLLDHNANVGARNKRYSRSPLHTFCKREGTLDMLELLVNAGHDVDHRDADGETPLLNAIFRRFTAAAQRLIELGADVNAANYSSQDSAIHFAVQFDHHEILQLLLEKEADYTARNIRGRTIAHMAARTAGITTFTILSEARLKNLDLSIKDDDGNTAADYLANRKLKSFSELDLHAAFEKLVISTRADKELEIKPQIPPEMYSPNSDDVEAQVNPGKDYHTPGAYPKVSDAPKSSEELHRETLAAFRCHYKSPCCFIFDAPRGVCSGVISYQSAA